MGLMDKLKGAMHAVTGGAATVTIEFSPSFLYPGDSMQVRVTATSTGAEVKSKGVFVDLRGWEEVRVKNTGSNQTGFSTTSTSTHEKQIQIGGEFVLGPKETKSFEAQVQVPLGVHPSYTGPNAKHQWEIRGRIEAWGNDPDSGFKPIRVGYRE
jgi:ribosomal protein L31